MKTLKSALGDKYFETVNECNVEHNHHKRTLVYFVIIVLIMALIMEAVKLNSSIPSQRYTLGASSHTCLGLVVLLGLLQTFFRRGDILDALKNKTGDAKKAKWIIAGSVGLVLIIVGLMIALESTKHMADPNNPNEKEHENHSLRENIAIAILVFVILAVLLVLYNVAKNKRRNRIEVAKEKRSNRIVSAQKQFFSETKHPQIREAVKEAKETAAAAKAKAKADAAASGAANLRKTVVPESPTVEADTELAGGEFFSTDSMGWD